MTQPTMAASGSILLASAISPGAGATQLNYAQRSTFQASGRVLAGSGTAVVKIQVSNDELGWLDAATMTLDLESSAYETCGFVMQAPWRFVRANLIAITGTGAFVHVTMGA